MLEPRTMPASYASFFMFILVHMLALVVSFLAIYARFRRLCSRYGDVSIFLTAYLYCFRLFCAQCTCSSTRVWFSFDHTRCMVFDYGKYIQQYCIYSIIHSLYIYYTATFTTVSIVSKRLITPVIIMLPPCSSSRVSSSHSYDETITNRQPRNDALALLSPPSVVLQKGGRGNAVAKARCLSLVHASVENREHSLHEGGGRLNQGDVFRYTIPLR